MTGPHGNGRACLMLLASVCCGTSMECRADSLWEQRNPQRAYLFHDSRARRVGDLLTIVVSESTEVDNREDKALTKATSASGVFDIASSTGGDLGTSSANGSLNLNKDTDRKFSGEASYSNSRAITDRMTVMVVGVMPNGNLLLSGHRRIIIEGEARTLRVTGAVRAIDIGPDNTVASQYIANMQTAYESDGAERRFTRQGWLGRGINKIWPF
ncbi:MAG: flagellar basal body L-ring protein FlgH [Planctomycetaceae bacterium]